MHHLLCCKNSAFQREATEEPESLILTGRWRIVNLTIVHNGRVRTLIMWHRNEHRSDTFSALTPTVCLSFAPYCIT